MMVMIGGREGNEDGLGWRLLQMMSG